MEPEEVQVRGEFILLQSLLKLLGYVSMGGEVKQLLSEGDIFVNGEPEARRGKKLRDGDVVTLPNRKRVVVRTQLP